MKKLLALALCAGYGAASAQTPAINPMPDGSRDMYVGLGVQSAPRYEGAQERKTRAVPVLQVQWSNGIFISGMTAGMHLTSEPGFEAGPLLAVQPSRSESGSDGGAVGVGAANEPTFGPGSGVMRLLSSDNPLAGMGDIHTRLLGGGFFNYYLSPQWRLTSSLLWGAGNDRHGGIAELGVQRLAADLAPHHSLALSAGLTVANRHYNQAFFGVTPYQSVTSGNAFYTPGGGVKDVHVSARWNWTLTPGWMITSNVQAVRLLGSAKNSPLVERPANVTVSTALAYRF
jgi:outer membrane scaffolding protein for murein synthesis (MipA/OmpV family)